MLKSFLILSAMSMMTDMEDNYNQRKEELLKRYEECKKMPRKKKKRVKKQILLSWSINEWSKKQFNF